MREITIKSYGDSLGLLFCKEVTEPTQFLIRPEPAS